jgi:hypothetical protein
MRERWPLVERGAHVKMHPEWRDAEAAPVGRISPPSR